MTPHRQTRTVHAPWLQIVLLCLFFLPGCSAFRGATANSQWIDMNSISQTNDPVKIMMRERALVSGDFMQQLVTECAIADVRNSGFGDVTRTVTYDGINKTFSFTLDTKNSGWISSMCGVPINLGAGFFSWLGTVASGGKPF